MLSKDGNPELKSLLAVLRAIGMHLWVVDQEFLKGGSRTTRYKYAAPDGVPDRLSNDR